MASVSPQADIVPPDETDIEMLMKVDIPILLNNLRLKSRQYREAHERPLTATFMEQSVRTIERLSAELAAANAEIARLRSYADGWAITAMERFEECERLKRRTVIVTEWNGRASQDGD